MKINDLDLPATAGVYQEHKQPFLSTAPSATSKELPILEEDVQVLHGFDNIANAENYLDTTLFTVDVVGGLAPQLQADPDIRICQVA